MLRRMSTNQFMNMKPASTQSSFPKLGEILVNLSVKDASRVERKLKLVGDPVVFLEYQDKVYVPGQKGKTAKVPFPDAEINRSMTRIGHEDPDQCPWKKQGYISTLVFAQNCLEQQEDGTWVPKILKKGKSIFQELAKWQNGRLKDMEDLDEDERENFIFHLGTRLSFPVRVTAIATGQPAPKSVNYEVTVSSVKPLKVTDEMIDALRKAGEPKAEELQAERSLYEADAKSDPSMPPWEDFFAYGYDLSKIFKHTPIRTNNPTEYDAPAPTNGFTVKAPVAKPVVEEEDEEDVVYVAKPTKKAAVKPEPVFEEEDGDDEDIDSWS